MFTSDRIGIKCDFNHGMVVGGRKAGLNTSETAKIVHTTFLDFTQNAEEKKKPSVGGISAG